MRVEQDGKLFEVWGNVGSEITVLPVEPDKSAGWRWCSPKDMGYGWAVMMLKRAEQNADATWN